MHNCKGQTGSSGGGTVLARNNASHLILSIKGNLKQKSHWGSAVQCSAVQCSALQCSTVQCITVQCSTVELCMCRVLIEQETGPGRSDLLWLRATCRLAASSSVIYTRQCTVYGAQCTVYSLQCTAYSVQCTVLSV